MHYNLIASKIMAKYLLKLNINKGAIVIEN